MPRLEGMPASVDTPDRQGMGKSFAPSYLGTQGVK